MLEIQSDGRAIRRGLTPETLAYLNGTAPKVRTVFGVAVETMSRDEMLACLNYSARQVETLKAELRDYQSRLFR